MIGATLATLFLMSSAARPAVLEMKVNAPVVQFDERTVEFKLGPQQSMKVPREFFKSKSLKRGEHLFLDFTPEQIKKISFYNE